MTVVINLLGGSGLGKTTTRSKIFSQMKDWRLHVEEVNEFVKRWAWIGRKPTGFDQSYIYGCQSQEESILYNKLDYIATDSPLLLSAYYEHYHLKREIVTPSVFNFLEYAAEQNVTHVNFLLRRNKKFDPRGRFEEEEQAKFVDQDLRSWLDRKGVPYVYVDTKDKDRLPFIFSYLEQNNLLKDIVEEDDN